MGPVGGAEVQRPAHGGPREVTVAGRLTGSRVKSALPSRGSTSRRKRGRLLRVCGVLEPDRRCKNMNHLSHVAERHSGTDRRASPAWAQLGRHAGVQLRTSDSDGLLILVRRPRAVFAKVLAVSSRFAVCLEPTGRTPRSSGAPAEWRRSHDTACLISGELLLSARFGMSRFNRRILERESNSAYQSFNSNAHHCPVNHNQLCLQDSSCHGHPAPCPRRLRSRRRQGRREQNEDRNRVHARFNEHF